MNPFNYGAASMAAMESDSAEALKRKKKAKAIICNRVTDTCLLTQCAHARIHAYQGADCNRHDCSRDQHLVRVDCVVQDA